MLSPGTALGQTIRAFYEAVQIYYPYEQLQVEELAVIETGIAFLQSVKAWWLEEAIGCQAGSTVQAPRKERSSF